MVPDEELMKPATLTCRIQSRNYPKYWGYFTPLSLSNDGRLQSICICVSRNEKLLFRFEWWIPRKHRPTWKDLYEKLDQILLNLKGEEIHE